MSHASRSCSQLAIAIGVAVYFTALVSGIWSGNSTSRLDEWPRVAWSRNIFQILSGAGGSFGFFSPDIGNQAVVQFEINDQRKIILQDVVSQEISLRLGNMYRTFIDAYDDSKLRRSVAASLTAEVFRRFPEAEKVTMIVSIYKLPSLKDYGTGDRPSVKEIYRVSFTTGSANAGK